MDSTTNSMRTVRCKCCVRKHNNRCEVDVEPQRAKREGARNPLRHQNCSPCEDMKTEWRPATNLCNERDHFLQEGAKVVQGRQTGITALVQGRRRQDWVEELLLDSALFLPPWSLCAILHPYSVFGKTLWRIFVHAWCECHSAVLVLTLKNKYIE